MVAWHARQIRPDGHERLGSLCRAASGQGRISAVLVMTGCWQETCYEPGMPLAPAPPVANPVQPAVASALALAPKPSSGGSDGTGSAAPTSQGFGQALTQALPGRSIAAAGTNTAPSNAAVVPSAAAQAVTSPKTGDVRPSALPPSTRTDWQGPVDPHQMPVEGSAGKGVAHVSASAKADASVGQVPVVTGSNHVAAGTAYQPVKSKAADRKPATPADAALLQPADPTVVVPQSPMAPAVPGPTAAHSAGGSALPSPNGAAGLVASLAVDPRAVIPPAVPSGGITGNANFAKRPVETPASAAGGTATASSAGQPGLTDPVLNPPNPASASVTRADQINVAQAAGSPGGQPLATPATGTAAAPPDMRLTGSAPIGGEAHPMAGHELAHGGMPPSALSLVGTGSADAGRTAAATVQAVAKPQVVPPGTTSQANNAPTIPPFAEMITAPAGAMLLSGSGAAAALTTPARPATVQVAAAMVGVGSIPPGTNGDTAGGTRLTIAMAPPAIGLVSIQIDRTTEGATTVAVGATHPETLAALQGDHAALAEMLTQAGVPIDHRSISFHLDSAPLSSGATASSSFGTGAGGMSQQGGGQQPGHQPGSPAGSQSGNGGARAYDWQGTATVPAGTPDGVGAPKMSLHRFGLDVMA